MTKQRNRRSELGSEIQVQHDEALASAVSRRNFLAAAGVGGAAVAAVAATGGIPHAGAVVASDVARQATSTTAAASSGASTGSGDVAIAQFAAGLEVLAVDTYQQALDAATAGKLGAVPPAGVEFINTALVEHRRQLVVLNQNITAAGQPAVTTPDAKLRGTVQQQLGQVTDFAGAAKLALLLEETAAATYLKAIPQLQSRPLRALVGSIQIVDRQHAAILNYVLGQYPVPDTFQKTDMAATP